MLAVRTRSGLIETMHDGVFAACDVDGSLIASSGDVEREFYLRSSAKPFQALVALENGADLTPLQTALACASHDGDPVHLAIVEGMLGEVGLEESALGCPPSWPIGVGARDLLVREGNVTPRTLWHNCSGKHAAWLRSCVAAGWPTDTYLDPAHPLQVRIRGLVSELGEHHVDPVGVDGCGAPVLRTTAKAMALMFGRLASDPRLSSIFASMHTYPALVSGTGNGDAEIATACNAAAKRGAAGGIGVAVKGQIGIAVKAWDGNDQVAAVAAVDGLDQLMQLTGHARHALSGIARPPIHGGGEVVGHLESRLELQR